MRLKRLTLLFLLVTFLVFAMSGCRPSPSPTTILQEGNNLSKTQLQPKQSRELEDNRIGGLWDLVSPEYYGDPDEFFHDINNLGLKRVRVIFDFGDFPDVDWSKGQYSQFHIKSHQDKTITGLAGNNIKMMCGLVFWDPESPGQKEEEGYSRFKTEEEIQRYLNYVQFIVRHFKDRIEYYEILNEPNIGEGTQQYVELADYINLVKRVVPVIRQEYPEAKIVVGATAAFREENTKEYLFGILKSDIMPLVDGVSFHPMYGTSPEYDTGEIVFSDDKQYYYEYPSLIREMKDVASAHGFKGEYIADELTWRTARNPNPYEPWTYSETVAAKYYIRGTIINLGLDLAVGLGALEPGNKDLLKMRAVQNLCTVMAGAKPISLPIKIQSEATNIRSYGFSLPNGDKSLALWADGVAIDDDPGIEATLTVPGLSAEKVIGIDVLSGFEQQVITNVEGGDLVISNLLVKDYPIILRFMP